MQPILSHIKALSVCFALLAALALAAPAGAATGKELIAAGNKAAMAGQLAKAVEFYTQAIATGQLDKANLAIAHANRGAANDDLGRTQQALADYKAAVAADPHYAPVYYNRSFTLEKLGRLQAALTDARQAHALSPDDWDYLQRVMYLQRKASKAKGS